MLLKKIIPRSTKARANTMVGPFFRQNFRSIPFDFWTFYGNNALEQQEIVKIYVAKTQRHRICARYCSIIAHK